MKLLQYSSTQEHMSRPKGGEGVSTACQMCQVKFISNDLISYMEWPAAGYFHWLSSIVIAPPVVHSLYTTTLQTKSISQYSVTCTKVIFYAPHQLHIPNKEVYNLKYFAQHILQPTLRQSDAPSPPFQVAHLLLFYILILYILILIDCDRKVLYIYVQ